MLGHRSVRQMSADQKSHVMAMRLRVFMQDEEGFEEAVCALTMRSD